MTKAEAIERARAVALAEGWPWKEPIFAQTRKTGILFGSRYWDVRTNCAMRGQKVEICLDDKTGEVLGKNFQQR